MLPSIFNERDGNFINSNTRWISFSFSQDALRLGVRFKFTQEPNPIVMAINAKNPSKYAQYSVLHITLVTDFDQKSEIDGERQLFKQTANLIRIVYICAIVQAERFCPYLFQSQKCCLRQPDVSCSDDDPCGEIKIVI